jgi:hypothetical protein
VYPFRVKYSALILRILSFRLGNIPFVGIPMLDSLCSLVSQEILDRSVNLREYPAPPNIIELKAKVETLPDCEEPS